jgi:hypothetical protein
MSDILHLQPDGSYALPPSPEPLPELPAVRLPEGQDPGVEIRPAVQNDFAFIDDLQKRHKHGVGFMWEKAIRGHITKGNVLLAEASGSTPVGYVLGVDRYLKRDELGIIYQINVEPAYQRSLVAANLLKAKFERSAYGCRLYCCWCAQDLPANRFWEAMGFVPLAFRTGGGRNKRDKDGNFRGRMHIFWQKRIRAGDHGDVANGGTAYWFPSLTGAGAIGEDRIVLPIPPGTHWSDAKPIVLPEGLQNGQSDEVKQLESEVQRLERQRKQNSKKKATQKLNAALPEQSVEAGGLRFGGSGQMSEAQPVEQAAEVEAELKAAKRKVKQAKKKFDPAQEAFARELKDRWLEQVLAEPKLLAPTREKYAVARRGEAKPGPSADPVGEARLATASDGGPTRGLPDAA